MKKCIVWLLAVLLLVTAAGCACANNDNPGGNPPSGEGAVTDAPATEEIPEQTIDLKTDSPAASEAPTSGDATVEPAADTPEPDQNTPEPGAATSDPGAATAAPASNDPGEFVGTTLVDNKECLVRVTGEGKDTNGYFLDVYLENKSAEKTYNYAVLYAAVNGLMWDPYFFTTVSPSKSKNDKIYFSDSNLMKVIDEFTDIELFLQVYDHDGSASDEVVSEVFHVYPLGKDRAKTYVREPQSTDHVLVENDTFSVVLLGCASDPVSGYAVKLFLVNKSKTSITLTAQDVSVNGIECEPNWTTNTVLPGKCAYSYIIWGKTAFDEKRITQVNEIQMILRAYDTTSASMKDLYKEKLTIHP